MHTVGQRIFIKNRINNVEYELLEIIGEGAYGKVYMGENTKTSVRVAIKSINLNGKQGFPVSALREIKQLKSLNHPNILKLVDVVIDGESDHWYKDGQCSVYMVFELGFHDLFGLISSRDVRFCEAQVKGWTYQLLSAVAYLHDNGLMHRDIKTSNILINLDGKLKLADFGLSRELKDPLKMNYNAKYTLPVVTLWYRAPELILGDSDYTTAIDVWSVGCVLGELAKRTPLFKGNTELEQIDNIFKLCGTPDEQSWPSVKKLPDWEKFQPKQKYKPSFEQHFKGIPPVVIDLLKKLLELDPSKRITAKEALNHPWFSCEPLPNSRPPKRLPSVQRNERWYHNNVVKRSQSQNGSVPLKDSSRVEKPRKMRNRQPTRVHNQHTGYRESRGRSISDFKKVRL